MNRKKRYNKQKRQRKFQLFHIPTAEYVFPGSIATKQYWSGVFNTFDVYSTIILGNVQFHFHYKKYINDITPEMTKRERCEFELMEVGK